jgi:hypothetical protein
VSGPFAIALGPAARSVFSPADRQYLLERGVALLRRRFPTLVAVDSPQAAFDRRFSTILELDVVVPPDRDGTSDVRLVLRVHDRNGTLVSVILGQLHDVDAKRTNQRKLIDEALPLIDAKADMLLR